MQRDHSRRHAIAVCLAPGTPEARLAKAADELETILQHVQGRNPADFDYRFNLHYGRALTASPPVIASLRRMLDEATEARALEGADGTESQRECMSTRLHACGSLTVNVGGE